MAEHAIMLMLNCAKKTRQVDAITRKAEWGPRRSAGVREMSSKTLGIIGVGNIGRIGAKIAGQGFGMKVLGYDPYVADDELRRRGVESLDELLPQVDVLTCHTPLTPETRGMINERTIGLMKPGAIFVNTSRGPVQQEHALFESLTRGKLAAAGLDVFEQEPVGADNPLLCAVDGRGGAVEGRRNGGSVNQAFFIGARGQVLARRKREAPRPRKMVLAVQAASTGGRRSARAKAMAT
ncbi:MAG: NAD(P)-dependent oxidoreductase [Candidatus Rokuibacteriota bacterium]